MIGGGSGISRAIALLFAAKGAAIAIRADISDPDDVDIMVSRVVSELGLERLVMAKQGYQDIQRVGRSLVYLDGVRLNI